MAAGDKIIIPAMAAGFFSMLGSITKGVGDTLNLPEGMANIGGNGFGYLLAAQVNWAPTVAGNHDGTVTAMALGDNVYLYAVRHASGTAQWMASKNSTVPTGYTATTSRKIGGFHFGRVRGIANRYITAYVPTVGIVPNSCWDLGHRPSCDPTGMAEFVPGSRWVDIYPNSEGSGVWPENVPISAYGVSIIRDTIYSRSDFHQLIANAGKRLPTVEEFLRYAEGAPGGLDASNDQAWSATTNTGPCTAGYVAKAISQYNIVDAVGNVWDWLDSHHDIGDVGGAVTPYVWDVAAVNVGKDAAIPRGSVSLASWRAFIGGGSWDNGVLDGARCLNSSASPRAAVGVVSLRGVCDSL